MKIVKYRSGRNGLYYEDGELINCTYNRAFGSYLWLVWNQIKEYKYSFMEIGRILKEFLEALLWLICLPALPFIQAFYIKKEALKSVIARGVKKPDFSKDYYEIINVYEDDEE